MAPSAERQDGSQLPNAFEFFPSQLQGVSMSKSLHKSIKPPSFTECVHMTATSRNNKRPRVLKELLSVKWISALWHGPCIVLAYRFVSLQPRLIATCISLTRGLNFFLQTSRDEKGHPYVAPRSYQSSGSPAPRTADGELSLSSSREA